MKGSVLLTVAICFMFLSAPVLASAVPNVSEGSWTSYKEVYGMSAGSNCPTGGTISIIIDVSGTVTLLGLTSCSITATKTITSISGGGATPSTTVAPYESNFGTYAIGFTSSKVVVFQSGALLVSLTKDAQLGNLNNVAISGDGQWITAIDSSGTTNIELWQGQGTAALLPLTSNVCVVGGSCNAVGNGQIGSVFGNGNPIIPTSSISSPNGNLTQAAQTVVNNPLPYGLIILIIIITIATAVVLKATKKKEGFRQPSGSSVTFGRP